MNPTRKEKLLFWLLLAAYSTFFAEVFAGSDMFPFFNIWGIFVVVPLYGLHSIILTTIIYKYGKPTLATLVFAGMLFGLYEAYMTKVLWQPSWDAAITLGEVAWVEVLVLVFWWHTWFSYITPLLLAEKLLTNSSEILNSLPEKFQRFYSGWKGYLALIIFGGIFQSINSPSVFKSFLSGFSSIGMLVLLTVIWQKTTKNARYSLSELLPNGKEFRFLALWLAALYIFLGFNMFPERLPGIVGQSIILAFYLLVIWLFRLALKKSYTHPIKTEKEKVPARKYWLFIGLVFIAVLVSARALLNAFLPVIVLLGWGIGSSLSLWAFWQAYKEIKPRPKNRFSVDGTGIP